MCDMWCGVGGGTRPWYLVISLLILKYVTSGLRERSRSIIQEALLPQHFHLLLPFFDLEIQHCLY